MRLIQRILLLLTFALMVTAVQAQAVFRSVMPDGKVVYGNKPEPGAKESKQVNLAPLNISTPTPAGSSGAADGAPPPGNNSAAIAAARQNLEAAQKALEAGREPREGERIGIATKGGSPRSQLTEAYQQRIKSLEDAVVIAQDELENALRAGR